MPRRNLLWMLAVSVVSLLCYQQVRHNRFGDTVARAIDLIEQRALEPVPSERLFEGAMAGVMEGLGDRFSGYVPPAEVEAFNEDIDQEFGGVGMEVVLDPQTKEIMVGSPLAGSPAQRAGILPGDHILRINDVCTQGLSREDAVHLMRGRLGEPVKLTVRHRGQPEPAELTIVRETIPIDTVVGDTRNADGSWDFMLEGHPKIGYVRLKNFGKMTADELRRALEKLGQDGMKALVLDLRDDHGGLLQAAVETCDLFLKGGQIVSTRGRMKEEVEAPYMASGRGPYTDFPMVVLVNEETASASEITAACLQDHGRAVVVGERSYGKGTVQEIIDLGDRHGMLRLTTASYWRPSGKNIHRSRNAKPEDAWGVMPDEGFQIVVDRDEQHRVREARALRDMGRPMPTPVADRQLDRAVDYLDERLKTAHEDLR